MEGHWNSRLPRVLDLLIKNRRQIEKASARIDSLNGKLQRAKQKLDKLQAKEEKWRDSYDFYYAQYYTSNTDGKIKTTNEHNKHVLNSIAVPNQQKQRVLLPDMD